MIQRLPTGLEITGYHADRFLRRFSSASQEIPSVPGDDGWARRLDRSGKGRYSHGLNVEH